MAIVASDGLDDRDENGLNSRDRFKQKYSEIKSVLDTARSGDVEENDAYDNSETSSESCGVCWSVFQRRPR